MSTRAFLLSLLVAVVAAASVATGAPPVGSQSGGHRQLVPLAGRGMTLGPPAGVVPESYGIVVQSSTGPDAVAYQVDQLGAGSWWEYSAADAGPPSRVQWLGTGRNTLPASHDDRLRAIARARPGSYWLVGNEPNLPGLELHESNDVVLTAELYAAAYKRYRDVILGADPSAKFVVGNALNFEVSNCGGCESFPSGRRFLEELRAAWRRAYSGELPVDAWGIHAYRIDWANVPMVDTAEPIAELERFRAWIDAIPEHAGKDIWLTEFGVIWGYERWCYVGDPLRVSNCGSDYAHDRVDAYIRTMLGWLRSNAARVGVRRWYVFASYTPGDPYMAVPGVIRLLDGPGVGASLTRQGLVFKELATQDG